MPRGSEDGRSVRWMIGLGTERDDPGRAETARQEHPVCTSWDHSLEERVAHSSGFGVFGMEVVMGPWRGRDPHLGYGERRTRDEL